MDINPLSTIEKPQIKEEYLKFGDQLLDRLIAKKIDLKEFLKEATYLALKCGFDEIVPHPLPTKPQLLFDYENLESIEQTKIKDKMFEDEKIKGYFIQKQRIIQQNIDNKLWLQELLGRLEQYGDFVNMAKVRNRIQEFELRGD